jgi:predicted TIM-barrel fold metal-dependent hydrolase
MKIDVFTHIMTEKYLAQFRKKAPAIERTIEVRARAVTDLNIRFRRMNRHPDVLQMLTIANVPLEKYVGPKDAIELARMANDELADLVTEHPDRFYGAAACLPMNDVDAALEEADRAIRQLRLRGVQIFSRINGEPLDAPQFRPLYKKMAEYDLPIWIHPTTNDTLDDDVGVFTWPFETTCAMYRLVKSGVFTEYPGIKFIVHHAGAMLPSFGERAKWIMSMAIDPRIHGDFRKFYVDTALYGSTPGLMCAYAYYGADHMLFGTDAPLGPNMVDETIASIGRMSISDGDKEKILKRNAVDLFRLAI